MVEERGRVVELLGYDEHWPDRFVDERQRILQACGDEVVAVEHIGSTAVAGLAAKPVIDIMVSLPRWPAGDRFIQAMESLGYHHYGEAGIVGRHYFTDGPRGGHRTRQVHAVTHGSRFWRDHLLFRDWLRAHPEDAAAYQELKHRLTTDHRRDVGAYTDAKTSFVREMLRRARQDLGIPALQEAALQGFQSSAALYERARPGYPAEAIDHLASALDLQGGRRVIDVGAGTGKLTGALVATGAEVMAVEPIAGMREILGAELPRVKVVEGTGEEMPLPWRFADAIVVGQAFHWFDPFAALSEFHRVLVGAGGVGLLWNVRDESVDWVARWTEIVQPVSSGAPRERMGAWREVLDWTELFTNPRIATFENPHRLHRRTVLERVASTSFVVSLDEDRREEVLEQIRHLLDTHPQTRDQEEVVIPYRTEVHAFRRVP